MKNENLEQLEFETIAYVYIEFSETSRRYFGSINILKIRFSCGRTWAPEKSLLSESSMESPYVVATEENKNILKMNKAAVQLFLNEYLIWQATDRVVSNVKS